MANQVRLLTLFTIGMFVFWTGLATTPVAASPIQDRDNGVTRPEIENFDVFLDGHAALARQLRSNPTLVNNEEFLENHPALQRYLENHPNLREELRENPRAFARRSERFEGPEARRPAGDRDLDIARGERAGLDMFLDNHSDIARQLSKDPSLADNPQYVKAHPELQQFLQTHPELRAELSENPQSVLGAEQRLERQESRGDVAGFDVFLDHHPAISQQLSKDPSLIRSQAYLQEHPELQQFLQTHPDLRTEMAENPNALMKAERQWDNREAARSDDFGRGMAKGELSRFEAFLDAHPQVSAELSRNPSLAKNEEYLESHPELQRMLNQNSAIQHQLKQNPEAFLNAATRTEDQHTVRPQPPQLTLLHPEQGLEKH
jgi:hypothetical protein